MGFRFRKSFGSGPFRVNVSKSGVGYSVGTKGLRYTKKAGGGTRTTASIPGTGISYVKDSSTQKERSTAAMNTNQQPSPSGSSSITRYCKYCYRMLDPNSDICPACGKSQIGGNVKSSSNGQLTGTHIVAIVIMILTLILTVTCCGNETQVPIEATEPTVQTEPTQPTETEPLAKVEETPWYLRPEFNSNLSSSNSKTYVLNTSTMKFHYSTCSSVDGMNASNKDTYTGTRDEVIAKGYEPCGRCNP